MNQLRRSPASISIAAEECTIACELEAVRRGPGAWVHAARGRAVIAPLYLLPAGHDFRVILMGRVIEEVRRS